MPNNTGNGSSNTGSGTTNTNTNTNRNGNDGANVRGVADVLIGDALIKLGFGYLTDVTNHYYTALSQSIRIQEAALTRQNQMYMASIERATTIMQNNLDITLSGFSKTANEIATQSLRLRASELKANIKAEKTKYLAEKEYLVKQANVQGEMINSFSNMTTNYATNMYDVYKGLLSTVDVGDISDAISRIFGEEGGELSRVLGGLGQLVLGFGKFSADIATQSVKLTNEAIQKQVSYNIQVLEYEKTKADIISQHIESVVDSTSNVLEKYTTLYETVQEWVSKADTASHVQAAQIGWGGRGDDYTHHMIEVTRDIAETFGRTTEELVAMQKAYIDESTRSVHFSTSDYNAMLGVGRGFGLSDSETAQMFGSMNVFNKSVASGESMLLNMYKSVTKMGLSASKFGKDLINNLQKAQKYNFKGGLENMMKITQWAQQTRFNLDAATGFSDKLLNGTISDSLEASAKLQVLGGAAAMYSDPIAMLYEAGADIGSLAKRQAAMFNDIQGTFNAKTGETDFSWYENYMIKQRAQAAGITEEDAKNMIRQRHKQKVINKELRNSNFDEEQRVAISNAALYNQKEGKWEVTDIQGNTYSLDKLMASNDAERKRILGNLIPENREDAMYKIARKSLGFAEEQTNLQAEINAKVGTHDYREIVSVSKENTARERRFYTDNANHIYDMTKTIRDKSSEALDEQYTLDEANMPHIKNLLDTFLELTNYTTNNVASIGGDINEIETALQEILDAYKSGEPYEKLAEKMFGDMYYPKMEDKIYSEDELMNLHGKNESDFKWYEDNLKPVVYGMNDVIIPWFKNNNSTIREKGLEATEATSSQAVKVIVIPFKSELKEGLDYGELIKEIGEGFGASTYEDMIQEGSNAWDRVLDWIDRNILHRNNNENTNSGNSANSDMSYNNIQPQQLVQGAVITPRSVDYNEQAALTPIPHSIQETNNEEMPKPQLPTIHYPALIGNDMVDATVVPISSSIVDLAESIQMLNESISNMQANQTQLTIDNDVHVTASGNNIETIKQAMLASLNDSTFTSKLTKGLSVVSSDSYQFNGHNSIT